MKTANFGSISHGTMRAVDLIPAFSYVLCMLSENGEYAELVSECDAWSLLQDSDDTAETETSEYADELTERLFEALQEAAPAYAYFGSHEGDGSDYGFWLSDDALSDFDGLRVANTSEVPADYSGEVLHVNDHGNATLYNAVAGSLTEVWSLV